MIKLNNKNKKALKDRFLNKIKNKILQNLLYTIKINSY